MLRISVCLENMEWHVKNANFGNIFSNLNKLSSSMEASTGCAEIPGALSQLSLDRQENLAELQKACKIVDH
jgi:hypothetical protein